MNGYRDHVRHEHMRALAALDDPERHQHDVLAQALNINADTEFGVKHGFAAIRGVGEFQRAVPIRDYTDYRPWTERARITSPPARFAVERRTVNEPLGACVVR